MHRSYLPLSHPLRLPTTLLPAVCERVGTPGEALLEAFKPRPYTELVGGKTMAQAGCLPILHMRGFQKGGALPDALVADITSRHA